MHINRFRVKNFSAFHDSGWIELSTGINIVVGQNNSGKTALLRALESRPPNTPHKNEELWRPERLADSEIYYEIETSGDELTRAIFRQGGTLDWPVQSDNQENEFSLFNEYFTNNRISLKMKRILSDGEFRTDRSPSHGAFEGSHRYSLRLMMEAGQLKPFMISSSSTDNLNTFFQTLWNDNTFFFSAMRFASGRSPLHSNAVLQHNAANLPAVLSRLQGDRGSVFSKLVTHLREIFPSTVQNLSVSPVEGPTQEVEILVWPTRQQTRRELSFSLDGSGTGVSQVIAILTIIMTLEQAVLVIDEINSFLHPAATKALMRIIRTEYSHHQYIISTHSPDVISVSYASSVYVVGRHGYDSRISRVDLKEIDQLRQVADDLGVSMTDVFAAEKIIWVEGATEERCIPELVRHLRGEMPIGLTITAVVATGDFEPRCRRNLIFRIYTRLSAMAQPLARSVTFAFDREGLSLREREDLSREASGRLLFLPRRHFECFLLEPEAIAAVINMDISVDKVTPADVEAHLKHLAATDRFNVGGKWNDNLFDVAWLAEVDAANLLKDTFSYLTQSRVSFTKTRHSPEILRYIMEHKPDILGDLLTFVNKLLLMADEPRR